MAHHPWTREITLSPVAVLRWGLALGSGLRLIQILTSFGSVDVIWWLRHLAAVDRHGLFGAYLGAEVINHPSLGLAIGRVVQWLGTAAGLEFNDSFRIFQAAADFATTLVLVRLARSLDLPDATAVRFGLFYYLSPAAVFVSAFHCNSDPTMILFIALAALAVTTGRPAAAGFSLAAAIGIKIVAAVAGPLAFLCLPHRNARLRYAGAVTVGIALIFVPAAAVSGMAMFRNIFGYTGWRSGWGLILLGDLAAYVSSGRFPIDMVRVALGALLASLMLFLGFEFRRMLRREAGGGRLAALIGAAFLLILVLAPGFMPYYLLWTLPWLPFALSWRTSVGINAAVSVYLFAIYTDWANEWPWVYAEGPDTSPAIGFLGLAVWATLAVAAVAALRGLSTRPAAAG